MQNLFTFKVETVNYQNNTNFEVICNSICFQNVGTQDATINQTLIKPGEFYNVSGNYGEIHQQQYYIAFVHEPLIKNIQVTTKTYTGLVNVNQLF